MKIYTEINYKWLDDQLVKTDSKSFEYEGEVEECIKIGGSLGAALDNISNQFKGGAKNFGTQTGAAADRAAAAMAEFREKNRRAALKKAKAAAALIESAKDAGQTNLETATDAGKEGLHDATDAGKTNLETGASAVKEGLHDATDAGKTNLEYGADAVSAGVQEVVKMFVEEPLEEVVDEATGLVPGNEGTKIDTFAKGSKGKKDKNNPFLAIKKGKKSARGSTKIRRTGTSSLKI